MLLSPVGFAVGPPPFRRGLAQLAAHDLIVLLSPVRVALVDLPVADHFVPVVAVFVIVLNFVTGGLAVIEKEEVEDEERVLRDVVVVEFEWRKTESSAELFVGVLVASCGWLAEIKRVYKTEIYKNEA